MSRMTPAQRHREKILAQKSEKLNAAGTPEKGSDYELQLKKLHMDRHRLKQIQSVEAKQPVKTELLTEYQPYVDGVLEGGKGAQDEILTTVLVWHIDVGNFDEALRIAEYALQHNLAMPDQYNRTLAAVLLDEIPEKFLRQPVPPPEELENILQMLNRLNDLTSSHDAPDQARAKLHKVIALALLAKTGIGDLTREQVADAKEAEAHLRRALELHDGSGVKTELKRLEARLEKATQG